MAGKGIFSLGYGQRGQALTEFLVAAVALVPLFLLVPMIAKYQDIAHATQMAARYVAFDAMARNGVASTWKPEAQLADEVRRRFFGNADAYIKTNDTAGNFKAHQNLFWRGPSDEPLIKDFNSDVAVGFGFGNGATHDAGFDTASDGSPFTGAQLFSLQARGIYTANVSVALANLPAGIKSYEPFDRIDLRIARSTSLVVDPWSAKDPAQAEARFGGNAVVFPGRSARSLSSMLDAFTTIIDFTPGPKVGQLEFWRDVVPQDRLQKTR